MVRYAINPAYRFSARLRQLDTHLHQVLFALCHEPMTLDELVARLHRNIESIFLDLNWLMLHGLVAGSTLAEAAAQAEAAQAARWAETHRPLFHRLFSIVGGHSHGRQSRSHQRTQLAA